MNDIPVIAAGSIRILILELAVVDPSILDRLDKLIPGESVFLIGPDHFIQHLVSLFRNLAAADGGKKEIRSSIPDDLFSLSYALPCPLPVFSFVSSLSPCICIGPAEETLRV